MTTKLSAKSARVLLSLVLTRRAEMVWSNKKEFATRSGLPFEAWSVPDSLEELADHSLVRIIHREGQTAQVVRVHEGYGYAGKVVVTAVAADGMEAEADPEHIGSAERLLLRSPEAVGDGGEVNTLVRQADNDADRGTSLPIGGEAAGEDRLPTNAPADRGGMQAVRREDHEQVSQRASDAPGQTDPLELCRLADENGSLAVKREALRAVWDIAFPREQYPSQRLTDSGVERLLRGGRSAEDVGRAIIDAPNHTTRKIEWPLSYVSRVLESMEREGKAGQDAEEEAPVITDDLRKLTELGRKLYGNAAQTPT